MVFVSIGVLITGVVSVDSLYSLRGSRSQVLLSLKSAANAAPDPYTVSAQPAPGMRLNPRSRVVSKQSDAEGEDEAEREDRSNLEAPKRDEVMWEVGSVSDDEDVPTEREGQPGDAKRGLGESSGRGTGERRGLLDEDEVDATGPSDNSLDDGKTPRRSAQLEEEEEEEGFGDYEAVPRLSVDEQRRRDG